MKIIGQHIILVDNSNTEAHTGEEILIEDCIIDNIDAWALHFTQHVTIKNCIIHKLSLLETFFDKGLTFLNNIVMSEIQYNVSLDNYGTFNISGNVFMEFCSFFDCEFNGPFRLCNNVFRNNSDMLFKENAQWDPVFKSELTIKNNIGRLDVIKADFDQWRDMDGNIFNLPQL